jgi:endonuclease/exonuclease/phosphatase family metal-dependent hydrolase
MTFNFHHGKGMDKQAILYRIAKVIDNCDADVIGLNEVDKHFSKRSLYEDQTSWLANQLKMDHAFSPSISITSKHLTEMRQYGNALLSRFPIITKKTHLFNNISGRVEGRSLLDATIQINRKLFQINVTHLSLNPFLHRKQTDFIVSQLHKYSHPLIIMGDWNMKPGSKGWRKLTQEFQDAWHIGGKGAGYTYPSLHPRTRLDYIFASRNLKVVDSKIVTNIPKASDHLPLTATLIY